MAASDSRLARSSRRRRCLVIRAAARAEQTAAPFVIPDPPVTDDRAEPQFPEIVESLPVEAPSPCVTPESAGGSSLQRPLSRAASLTWMYVGDSLEPPATAGRDWRSFAGRLTETIRQTAGRSRDVVIEQLAAGQTLSAALDEATESIARFRPDLLLVSIGPHEAAAGRRGLAAFEQALTMLIHRARQGQTLPILCTPPRVPTAEAKATVDQLIYAEAVRSIAAEYDLPLVDHFAHWEAAAASARGNDGWFDSSVALPGRFGHQQLTARIVADLQLCPREEPQPLAAAIAGARAT